MHRRGCWEWAGLSGCEHGWNLTLQAIWTLEVRCLDSEAGREHAVGGGRVPRRGRWCGVRGRCSSGGTEPARPGPVQDDGSDGSHRLQKAVSQGAPISTASDEHPCLCCDPESHPVFSEVTTKPVKLQTWIFLAGFLVFLLVRDWIPYRLTIFQGPFRKEKS